MAEAISISLEDKHKFIDRLKEITDGSDNDQTNKILHDILVITRDKSDLEQLFTKNVIDKLIELADKNRETGAQKCLSNLVMNNSALRGMIVEPYCECAARHFQSKVRGEVEYFDLRIVFLLSALSTDDKQKAQIRDKLEEFVLEIARDVSKNAEAEKNLCEALKVLFNFSIVDNHNHAERYFDLILSLLKRDIRADPRDKPKEDQDAAMDNQIVSKPADIHSSEQPGQSKEENEEENLYPLSLDTYSHVIDLITEMNNSIYQKFDEHIGRSMMKFVDLFLDNKPNKVDHRFIPIFRVLSLTAAKNRTLRKAWKEKILPSEKTDFMQRPEIGDSLRARIVRLLTYHDLQVKNSAALFLFVLCKQNVNRFVKYTGYGNAAGYLANLTQWNLQSQDCDFSPDEDDSEGETAKRCNDDNKKMNLVTGAYEEPRPHPMDNMSEEEKEYHAVQLANAMSKMSKLGIIKPIMKNSDDLNITPSEIKESKNSSDDSDNE